MASSYREFASPPGLEAHVACVWVSHDRAVRVLPDACADIVLSAGRLAAEAGYADQAHLTRECRRLSGLPPAALPAAGATAAGEKSDSFKPRRAQSATLAA